jgi:lysophospholipase L1-like esterase
MKPDALANLVRTTRCRVFGHEDASNAPQRAVLAALIRGFDHLNATVLCEPSLARNSTRPPDAVLVEVCWKHRDDQFADLFHPNSEGAKIIAEEVFRALVQVRRAGRPG